jgi:hypothetical protein
MLANIAITAGHVDTFEGNHWRHGELALASDALVTPLWHYCDAVGALLGRDECDGVFSPNENLRKRVVISTTVDYLCALLARATLFVLTAP